MKESIILESQPLAPIDDDDFCSGLNPRLNKQQIKETSLFLYFDIVESNLLDSLLTLKWSTEGAPGTH